MTIEKYILEALQKGVIAAVATTTLPGTAVKYVGLPFTPPDDQKWLEVIYVPNNIENECWDECKTHQGILRLLLHWPVNSESAYNPITLIETIAAYFTKGLRLADPGNNVRVKITNTPNFLGPIEQAPETLYPLSIRYQFFKAA